MTIEEKRQAIIYYCKENSDAYNGCKENCKLYNDENVIKCHRTASKAEIEYNYKIIFGDSDTENLTRNLAEVSDTFICEKCKIHLEDCVRDEYDEYDECTYLYEYEFKFCPECGRKIVEE